jgi:myosin heavy subunit
MTDAPRSVPIRRRRWSAESAAPLIRRSTLDFSEARVSSSMPSSEPSVEDEAVAQAFFKKLAPELTPAGTPKNILTLTNDLLDLSSLTVPSMLDALEKRFKKEVAYAYTGAVVVSVNPFKDIGSTSPAIIAKYKGLKKLRSLPPHIYGLCAATYNAVTAKGGGEPTHQSIVISGESGAGKTEAMKIYLSYIVAVAGRGASDDGPSVGDKLLLTNPVMEAMGNAKTTRNNNVSARTHATHVSVRRT